MARAKTAENESRLGPRRPLRLALGLALLGLSVALLLAPLKLPFLRISTGSESFVISAALQSDNLHLVLVSTGAVGALLALIYLLSGLGLRYAFFVVGGVGAAFAALLLLGAYQELQAGRIADPEIYRRVRYAAVELEIGSGLWTCLAVSVAIVLLGIPVFRASAPAQRVQR